jgi:hypothetical protein
MKFAGPDETGLFPNSVNKFVSLLKLRPLNLPLIVPKDRIPMALNPVRMKDVVSDEN